MLDLNQEISKAYDWIVRVTEKQERLLDKQTLTSAYSASFGKNRLSDYSFGVLYDQIEKELTNVNS